MTDLTEVYFVRDLHGDTGSTRRGRRLEDHGAGDVSEGSHWKNRERTQSGGDMRHLGVQTGWCREKCDVRYTDAWAGDGAVRDIDPRLGPRP